MALVLLLSFQKLSFAVLTLCACMHILILAIKLHQILIYLIDFSLLPVVFHLGAQPSSDTFIAHSGRTDDSESVRVVCLF